MVLGHENRECLRLHDIDGRGESEPVKLAEGFFFCDRGHYTIFLYSRPDRESLLSLNARHESWPFLAIVQKIIFPNSCGKRRLRRRFPSLVMKNFIPNLCVKA